ncbi:MAG: hypothetical protein BGO97_06110 [Micrococcales bacterium 70-64]|nr:hypothetical protein [Leifsonia sp.]ODU63644.1 MAG: hypothetical protein ABT06_06115 [Leifsonia sp. SCN 70-46]OJX85335.1 MAG: hypothetical protein BGO97_06110 [Micrococcales bacterium 70-64]
MTAAAPAPANAGKTLGIVGLILSFFSGPIGLIVSAVARSQSKKAGLKNGPATAGIVIGLLSTIALVAIIVGSIVGASALLGQCADLGPGVHESNGVTITCGE